MKHFKRQTKGLLGVWAGLALVFASLHPAISHAEDEQPKVHPPSEEFQNENEGDKDEGAESAPADSGDEGEAAPAPAKKSSRSKGGGGAKEAEGSKAPNRFQTDAISKSYYRRGGESLEVDPD